MMAASKPTSPCAKKLKNTCEDCDKDISPKAKRCKSCSVSNVHSKNGNCNRPPLEELQSKFEELNQNYTATGKFYDVSDNAVRKWFKFYYK